MTQAEFEKVHTIHDWWDGPRAGFADFEGRPHLYLSPWDETIDDWSPIYGLAPVDPLTFAVAQEAWGIWRRWEEAFHSGRVETDSHPALPEDRARWAELNQVLKPWFDGTVVPAAHAYAEFRAKDPDQSPPRELEVRWRLVPPRAGADAA
jgi:hypothetical protein